MIDAVIIEDEKAAYENLKELLSSSFSNQITIAGIAKNVNEAIQLINSVNPKLVFLDIELENGNGFELLDFYSDSTSFEVIFTTGLHGFKEKAMDYFAFYYLTKPIQKEKLCEVVNKFLEKHSAFDAEKYFAFKNLIENKSKKIALPIDNGGYKFIELDDIIYCEADGSYTHFFTNDKKYITSNNLKKVEDLLKKANFFRVHRSQLVNLKHISQFNNKGEIMLTNGKKLTVSSRNKGNFMRVLKLMNYSID